MSWPRVAVQLRPEDSKRLGSSLEVLLLGTSSYIAGRDNAAYLVLHTASTGLHMLCMLQSGHAGEGKWYNLSFHV